MANEKEVFQAHITAKDEASKTVEEIGAKVKHLGHEFAEAGKASEHMHQVHGHAFAGMTEHIHLFRHELGGLTASLGETGSKVSELLPVFAAFGAAASLEGFVENIDRVAETFSKLSHEAINAGVSLETLQGLHFAAALSDTSPEVLDTALMRLNKTLGEIATGGGKDALALLKQLHIATRDVKGDPRSAGDILPEFADAIMHTRKKDGMPNAPMRERMTTALIGKSGGELIDFLGQGGSKIRAAQKDFKNIGFSPSPEDKENLEAYHTAMIRLQTSSQAAMQAIGTAATPAISPILDSATDFLTTHRKQITDTIASDLTPVKAWIDSGGLDRAVKGMEHIAHDADAVVTSLGGWGHAIEAFTGLMVLKGVSFLAEPIKEAATLTKAIGKIAARLTFELVPAWGAVAESAGAAGAAEAAATAGGVLKGLSKVFAGAAFVDWLDSNDTTGRFMDKHVPGAGYLDSVAFRFSGGAIGHPEGWTDKPQKSDGDEAGDDKPDALGRSIGGSDGGEGYKPPMPGFTSWNSAPGDLPRLYDSGPLPNLYGQAPLPPAGGYGGGAPPQQGFVEVKIDVTGLPPGAQVSSSGRGAAAQPEVRLGDLPGRAWGGF